MFLCASEDDFLQGLHSEAKQRVLKGVASYSEYNFHYCLWVNVLRFTFF